MHNPRLRLTRRLSQEQLTHHQQMGNARQPLTYYQIDDEPTPKTACSAVEQGKRRETKNHTLNSNKKMSPSLSLTSLSSLFLLKPTQRPR